MSTRADEIEKQVDAGFQELARQAEDAAAREFRAKLAFAVDATRQFVAASQGTLYFDMAVTGMMAIEAAKNLRAALPEEMRQCSECAKWFPYDDVCESYQPEGGRLYERLCGECACNLAREYGEDN